MRRGPSGRWVIVRRCPTGGAEELIVEGGAPHAKGLVARRAVPGPDAIALLGLSYRAGIRTAGTGGAGDTSLYGPKSA